MRLKFFCFLFCSRLCGNRIRVEMSSGRSRQQSRGGRGGGGGGGRDYRRYGGNDNYSSRSRGSYRLEYEYFGVEINALLCIKV